MKSKLAASVAVITFFLGAISIASTVCLAEKMLDYPKSSEGIELIIKAKTLPRFPQSLKNEGYSSGTVNLIVEIDEFGELRDHIVSETTKKEFADAVERVIHTWDFDPPKWQDTSVPVITRIKVNFESHGDVVSFDLSSGLMYKMIGSGFMQDTHKQQNLVPVNHLDALPSPIIVVNPLIPNELLADNLGTNGTFSFYIDQNGQVRMPALEKVDGEVDSRLLSAVQDALLQWKFDPPTANGKPVVVQVFQQFNFSG